MANTDVEVSPTDLRFRFQLNKQLLATITISNPNSQRVAFKIKTTAPKKYVVRPSSGVVDPRSNVSVQVIMQAQKEFSQDFVNCKDKFMVQTTALGETEQIEKDTFNKDVRRDLKEYRLRVIIEGPPAPPSPVPEANEADEEAVARASAPALAAPVPATSSVVPGQAEAAAPDTRLRSVMDNLTAATSENNRLKSEVDRLQRAHDDLRRQLDGFQMQAAGSRAPSAAPAQAVAAKPAAAGVSILVVLLAAILAFIAGHYLRF